MRLRNILALQDHGRNLVEIRNVCDGIGVEQHEISILSLLDGSHRCLTTHKLRAIQGRRLQNLERRESHRRELKNPGWRDYSIPSPQTQLDSAGAV